MKTKLVVMCSVSFICAMCISPLSAMDPAPKAQTHIQGEFNEELTWIIRENIMCPKELTDQMQKEILQNNGLLTWRGVKFRVVGGIELIKHASTEFFRKQKVEGGWFGTRLGATVEDIIPPAFYVRGLQQNMGNGSTIRASYTFLSSQAEAAKGAWYNPKAYLASAACKIQGTSTETDLVTIEHAPEDGNPIPIVVPEELDQAKKILGLRADYTPKSQDIMNKTMQLIQSVTQHICQSKEFEGKSPEELSKIAMAKTEKYKTAFEVMTLHDVNSYNRRLKAEEDQMRGELMLLDEQKKKLDRELAQGTHDLENMKAEQAALRKQQEQDQAKIQALNDEVIELKTGKKPEGITYGGMGEQPTLRQVQPSTKSLVSSSEETADQKKLRERREKLEQGLEKEKK